MESKAKEMRHIAAMKKSGVPKKIIAEEAAEAAKLKCGGVVKKPIKKAGGGSVW